MKQRIVVRVVRPGAKPYDHIGRFKSTLEAMESAIAQVIRICGPDADGAITLKPRVVSS